jgi:two-component system, LytTR family, response regulator AlgR
MRVLIVDDEPAARRRLARLIEEIDAAGVEVVGEAADGVAALELARERRPDVILLDIAMREVDGFDVARHLAAPRPLIIFQTAYRLFAVKAFEHDALDYVVKPVRKERLAAALERARARLTLSVEPRRLDSSTFRKAGSVLGYAPVTPARLLVRYGAGHRLMPLADIVRFSAADGVVFAHSATGAPLVDYTITELESRMAGGFVRTSRADLVNVDRIERIAGNGDGSLTLSLDNGTAVRVSRRRAAGIKRLLEHD